jgi:hypothetical protein
MAFIGKIMPGVYLVVDKASDRLLEVKGLCLVSGGQRLMSGSGGIQGAWLKAEQNFNIFLQTNYCI